MTMTISLPWYHDGRMQADATDAQCAVLGSSTSRATRAPELGGRARGCVPHLIILPVRGLDSAEALDTRVQQHHLTGDIYLYHLDNIIIIIVIVLSRGEGAE